MRALADHYLDRLVAVDPILATSLGIEDAGEDLPDLSPDGLAVQADLARDTLSELDRIEAGHPGGRAAPAGAERRCGRLLRERLSAQLDLDRAGEPLRTVGTLASPVQAVRDVFLQMPATGTGDWRRIGARLERVGPALEGYRRTLSEGLRRGLPAGPTQVSAVIDQLARWGADGGWFTSFAAAGAAAVESPDRLRRAAACADEAVAELRSWLIDDYAPAVASARDPVGADRYRMHSRYWNGADLDPVEAYHWGWDELARLDGDLRAGAREVLPGRTPVEAMRHLAVAGPAIEGVEQVRAHLQGLMDAAIAALDGTHFDVAEPVRRVEAMIAPAGTAAAPYYTPPSLDFARPGRTWLPTMGRTRFPTWDLVSTWYHEGVPGHHLQLAQWVLAASRLTRYQSTVGMVSANAEGWALYAERLMDELGFLADPGERLGYLDAQQMRTVRVIVDIGMHLELEIPHHQGLVEPFHPGRRWTPELALAFFGEHSGRSAEFLESEIVRYLGMPGQAIGYKLGERAWLAGRSAARAAHERRGEPFDLRAWHMAALSQGSLGLDDLVEELALL